MTNGIELGRRRRIGTAAIVGWLLATGGIAAAQATRTWVSGVGDDANPCSRTAPCKTFAGAISKTAAGGEIDALDPGSFGAVTITKSITIDGGSAFASILASATNGVVVNAAPTDRIVLRRLSINGAGVTTGVNGIRYLAGDSLWVEGCLITTFSNFGIDHQAHGTLVVDDTVIRNIGGGAIESAPSSGNARVVVQRSRFEDGAFGLHLVGNVLATARQASASENGGAGFWAEDSPAELNLTDVTSVQNDVGIRATNGAVVRTRALAVAGNTSGGLLTETGGTIYPFSGDLVAGNPAGGPTTCEVGAGTTTVSCVDATCPQPACPQPACPAPVVQTSLGKCKHCKTKGGKMVCVGCGIDLN